MQMFDFSPNYAKMLTPDIVALLTQIHEYKGGQALLIEVNADSLPPLLNLTRLQSTKSSNRIEGICTSDERLKKLAQDKTTPHTRSEQKIAGYREVLAAIHKDFDYIPPKSSTLLQLHRELYQFSGSSFGGHYKTTDPMVAEADIPGNQRICCRPLSAGETPGAMDCLCWAYEEAIEAGEMDPLILIPMFILDFLCIYPFDEGNGQMSRLLTLLLLRRAGYIVGQYISIEKLIEDSKESYYEAIQLSSVGWHESANDYVPFVRYTLRIVAAAYQEFFARVRVLSARGVSKPDRVRNIIRNALGKITKGEIMAQCPDISQITVQRALIDLQKSGEIKKVSSGRYAAYIWNRQNSL